MSINKRLHTVDETPPAENSKITVRIYVLYYHINGDIMAGHYQYLIGS